MDAVGGVTADLLLGGGAGRGPALRPTAARCAAHGGGRAARPVRADRRRDAARRRARTDRAAPSGGRAAAVRGVPHGRRGAGAARPGRVPHPPPRRPAIARGGADSPAPGPAVLGPSRSGGRLDDRRHVPGVVRPPSPPRRVAVRRRPGGPSAGRPPRPGAARPTRRRRLDLRQLPPRGHASGRGPAPGFPPASRRMSSASGPPSRGTSPQASESPLSRRWPPSPYAPT